MDLTKIIVLALVALWLLIMTLQATNQVKFGKVKMPKSWIFYFACGIVLLTFADFAVFGFDNSLLSWLYPLSLAYLVIFNSAIIFDWYSYTQFFNRVEHIWGSFILMILVYSTVLQLEIFPPETADAVVMASAVGFATIVGVVNEIMELFLDGLFKTSEIGPEVTDTNWDLLMNMIGFGLFVLLYFSGYLPI